MKQIAGCSNQTGHTSSVISRQDVKQHSVTGNIDFQQEVSIRPSDQSKVGWNIPDSQWLWRPDCLDSEEASCWTIGLWWWKWPRNPELTTPGTKTRLEWRDGCELRKDCEGDARWCRLFQCNCDGYLNRSARERSFLLPIFLSFFALFLSLPCEVFLVAESIFIPAGGWNFFDEKEPPGTGDGVLQSWSRNWTPPMVCAAGEAEEDPLQKKDVKSSLFLWFFIFHFLSFFG